MKIFLRIESNYSERHTHLRRNLYNHIKKLGFDIKLIEGHFSSQEWVEIEAINQDGPSELQVDKQLSILDEGWQDDKKRFKRSRRKKQGQTV